MAPSRQWPAATAMVADEPPVEGVSLLSGMLSATSHWPVTPLDSVKASTRPWPFPETGSAQPLTRLMVVRCGRRINRGWIPH